MKPYLSFATRLVAGHAAFSRRAWHAGAPRTTIEDHLAALWRHVRGTR